MAKRISELRTANKAGNTSREYVLLSNIDSNTSTKIALNDVFPTLQSGKASGAVTTGATTALPLDIFVGGGVGSSTANTDKSILIFKGLQVDDPDRALLLRNDKSTADGTKQNLVIQLDHTKIKLHSADNTVAEFLSESGGSNPLNLATSTISGTLPITRGGTGATSFTSGGLLYGNAGSPIGAMAQLGAASILVGSGSGAPNELTVGTNNYVLTADSTAPLGLKWAKPTINAASFTSVLNMNNNNITLGSGYLTGTGAASAGITLSSSSDYVYIGSNTKFFDTRLNVEGGITLGSSNGSSSQTLQQASCSSGASPTLNILGSNNLANSNGGDINISAGAGHTAGNGGSLHLGGGVPAGGGTAGSVYLKTNSIVGLGVDSNQDVNVTNNLTLNQGKTLEWRGTETVTQLTSITTAVTLNASAGVIVLHATSIAGHDSHYFTFNNSLITSRSIILLTCEVSPTEAAGAGLIAQVASRAAGSVQIRVTNSGNAASSTNHSIHFLIMNVYV